MKRILLISSVVLTSLFLASCGDWSNVIPKSSFDSAFPKTNKDLTQILGNKLYIKRGKDTTIFNIADKGKQNLITDKNGDTIFCGSVSKFRGLYYFSQQLTDTSFLIYAVKVKGNYLYGLNAPWYEGLLIDRRVQKGEYKDMVKSISADGKVIRLHVVKDEMRKLYAMIMDSLPPDTLLAAPVKKSVPVNANTPVPPLADTSFIAPIDPEEYDIIAKVYPNPVKTDVTIELQRKENVKYTISNILGKPVMNGELHDSVSTIDTRNLASGFMYILTLTTPDGKSEESVKLVKPID